MRRACFTVLCPGLQDLRSIYVAYDLSPWLAPRTEAGARVSKSEFRGNPPLLKPETPPNQNGACDFLRWKVRFLGEGPTALRPRSQVLFLDPSAEGST